MARPTIIVHGGAGEWPREKQASGLNGVKAAAIVGWKILTSRGSSIDAVEASVVSMEDNPVFNAGTGSALNLAGNVEMDAAIMEGKQLNGGAVAIVRRVKNPVRLARIVMEETNHVLLAGLAAERLALNHNIPSANPKTRDRIRAWKQGLKGFRKGQTGHLSRNYRLLEKGLLKGLDRKSVV